MLDALELSHAQVFALYAGEDPALWQGLLGCTVIHKLKDRGPGLVKVVRRGSSGFIVHVVPLGDEHAKMYGFSSGTFSNLFPQLLPTPEVDRLLTAKRSQLQEEAQREAEAERQRQVEYQRQRDAAARQARQQAAEAEQRRKAAVAEAAEAIERERLAAERRKKMAAAAEAERRQRLYSPALRRMMREAWCWACQADLVEYSPDKTPDGNRNCRACGWMLCNCGACRSPLNDLGGCDQQIVRLGPELYEQRLRERSSPTTQQASGPGRPTNRRTDFDDSDLDDVPSD